MECCNTLQWVGQHTAKKAQNLGRVYIMYMYMFMYMSMYMNRSMSMAKGKGKVIRPCHVCAAPVNFVWWEDESKKRRSTIYHWANPDGSHHVHVERGLPVRYEHRDDRLEQEQLDHLNSILREE